MKISRYLAVALCILAASCAKENIGQDNSSKLVELTLEAYSGEDSPETKTLIGPDGSKVFWADGDQISLFFGNGNNGGSCFTTANGGETASFTGTLNAFTAGGEGYTGETTYFWGVYPYNTSTTCDNNSVTVTIPSEQLGVAGTFAPEVNISVGRSENLKMGFYNVCSGFSFYVSTEGITEVLFKSKGGIPIVGDATVQFEVGKPKVVNLANGSDEVRLLPEGGEFEVGKKYYLEFIPTTLEGFTVTIYNNKGREATFEYAASREFVRSKFTNVNGLDTRVGGWTVRQGNISFADPKFKAYCITKFDTNEDGEISYSEASEVGEINVNYKGITSLDGIQYFTSLETLYCNWNQLTSLVLSNNTALTRLNCNKNQLTTLDVSKNTVLTELWCQDNKLTSLDISNNVALTTLECNINQLATLDVRKNLVLKILECDANKLNSLDVSNNTALTHLSCGMNKISALDVSNNTALIHLNCATNNISTLDVSNNTALTRLWCADNKLTALDVSNNTALTELLCRVNKISALDVSNNTALTHLDCGTNNISTLDVSNNTALYQLWCFENKLTTLDVSTCTTLTYLDCSPMNDENGNNLLKTLYIYNGQSIDNVTSNRDPELIPNATEITDSTPGGNEGVGEDDLDNNISFADPKFKAYCVQNFDTNEDGEISYSEAASVTTINCSNKSISSMNEVGYFSALTSLTCDRNQITSLDISKNTVLTFLSCGNNLLKSLDVSRNTALTKLLCGDNQLTSLDVSNNTELKSISCEGNQLTSLDVSNNPVLEGLYFYRNQLANIDLSHNTNLKTLSVGMNKLTSLDISKNTVLTTLDCQKNLISSLDISKNLAMRELICNGNQLSSLDVSNNNDLRYLYCGNNQLTGLDVSNNTYWLVISCENNRISTLDTSNCPSLRTLLCEGNLLTTLDVSNCKWLERLDCSPMNDDDGNNLLETLYLSDSHVIDNITYWQRNSDYVPDDTNIIFLEK